MAGIQPTILLPIILLQFGHIFVQQAESTIVGGNEDVSSTVVKSQPFAPQVVFQCGYRNRYSAKDGSGEWTTDKDPHANCLKGKLDILKYCRKVYPDLEITNIVESSHYYEVSNWCKLEGQPCKWSFWVKPYRCIVGAFESEALLVPESCHFGHLDDRNLCKDFDHWNETAHSECTKRAQTPSVKSFAMLEPCGLDMFSGVEYVCCPRSLANARTTTDSSEPRIDLNVKVKLDKTQQQTNNDEDEDDYSDEDDDEDDDDNEDQEINTGSPSATGTPKPATKRTRLLTTVIMGTRSTVTAKPSKKQTTTAAITSTTDDSDDSDDDDDEDDEDTENTTANSLNDEQDPYFRVADPDKEHSEYLAALERLEKRHREKVAKVMKEWSELEARYQEMKEKDPNRGEQFRNEMTSRFQRTVSALEEENRDEKRQIDEVHQQRVNAGLNERKRETIKAFRDALAAAPPQSHKILRTLQAYIRAEEKDRVHALNRYRHLLRSDVDAASSMKTELLKKLNDIDLRINGTIEMLSDAPEIEEKVKPAALEFWKTFRDENTPKIVDDTVSWGGDKKDGDRMLDAYKKEYQDAYKAKESDANDATFVEPKKPIITESKDEDQLPFPASNEKPQHRDTSGIEIVRPIIVEDKKPLRAMSDEDDLAGDNDEQAFIEQEDERLSHSFALKETIQHEAMIKEEEEMSLQPVGVNYGYIVFGIAGTTLLVSMLFGIMFVKRRFSHRGQGFVEVDPSSPEERHVAGMQVNGYENPTYKYFDDKA